MDKFISKTSSCTDSKQERFSCIFILMKVLLQNVTTKLYFRQLGSWTDDVEKARDFPNSLNAINFCNSNGLKEVRVLLKFKQSRYDVALPVIERTEPH